MYIEASDRTAGDVALLASPYLPPPPSYIYDKASPYYGLCQVISHSTQKGSPSVQWFTVDQRLYILVIMNKE